jgi:hypothetical protein
MMATGERTQRMTTGIERVFRADPMRSDLYREILLHWIYFLDPESGETTGMKLDKQIEAGIWKVAVGTERSLYGEITYTFPDGIARRLVCLRENVAY